MKQCKYTLSFFFQRENFGFRSILGLLLLTALFIPHLSHALYIADFDLPPQDANGWTILTPEADSRIIYVDATLGDDATGEIYFVNDIEIGSDPQSPVGTVKAFQTISVARDQLRSSAPDWMLLKSGEFWETGITLPYGESDTKRAVVSSYGVGARPELRSGAERGINNLVASKVIISGIKFWAHTRDTDGPYFVSYGGSEAFFFYNGNGSTHHVLFEDVVFRSYTTMIATGSLDVDYPPIANLVFRRNIVSKFYRTDSLSTGFYHTGSEQPITSPPSILLEENVFDHNGWLVQAGSDGAGWATAYNHNLYFANPKNVLVTGNIFMRASSINNKFTANDGYHSTYKLVVDNNLYVEGEIGISAEGNHAGPHRFHQIEVTNNVLTDIGRTSPTNRDFAIYIETKEWDDGIISGNLLLNQTNINNTNVGAMRLYSVDGARQFTIEDNYIYNIFSTRALVSFDWTTGSTDLKFANNVVYSPFEVILMQKKTTQGSEFSGTNKYFSGAISTTWFNIDDTKGDIVDWTAWTGDTGAVAIELPPWNDPDRNLERYSNDVLGLGYDFEAFITALYGQSKSNWDAALTAPVINDWFRAGFASRDANAPPTVSFTVTCADLVCDFGATVSTGNDGGIYSYDWDFGDGETGTGVTMSHRYSTGGNYTVTLTATTPDSLSDPTPAMRVITVADPNSPEPIPQESLTLWSLWSVDSEELLGEDGAAVNAFDGDVSTLWVTQWKEGDPIPPHSIEIDLGEIYTIDGFTYIPRQDGVENGRIADYEFYVSMDGVHWDVPVSSGRFLNDASAKEEHFIPVEGRYIRLRALSEVNGNPWTAVAELKVLGAPNGIIDTPSENVTINVGEGVDFSATGSDINGDFPLTYEWRFDDGSGTPELIGEEDPGMVLFDVPGTYTVTLVVINPDGLSDPTPATRVITVAEPNSPEPIPQESLTLWSLWSVDSEELLGEDGAAVNAFDGDVSTLWVTQWTEGDPILPHSIEIDLGEIYTIDGFTYIPRQDGVENGRIADYEFYVSMDGVHWDVPVSSGRFLNDASAKEEHFIPVEGRYIRLRALSEVNGNPWTAVAELKVLGAPNVIIDIPRPIPQESLTLWSLWSVDSEELLGEDGAAVNAFDGDVSTLWVTQWKEGDPIPPHSIEIDLGEIYTIDGFTYIPRQDGVENGRIADYEFYVSMDGVHWDVPVSSGRFLNDASAKEEHFIPVEGRYIRLRALSEVNGNPWTAVAELKVLGAPNVIIDIPRPIPQESLTLWSLWSVDSEELLGEDGAAVNAFDGDVSTLWVTQWKEGDPIPPHSIEIDLGEIYAIDGFTYIPRQDGVENGRIADYEFYVSMDGVNWDAPVTTGRFLNDASAKEEHFIPVEGRYIRLRALSEVNGNPWTTVAEIQILGQ